MRNFLPISLLCLVSFFITSCCHFVPPIPKADCQVLKGNVQNIDHQDILYINKTDFNQKAILDKVLGTKDPKTNQLLYSNTPIECPCGDPSIVLLTANPENPINPEDRRDSAEGAIADDDIIIGKNFSFPFDPVNLEIQNPFQPSEDNTFGSDRSVKIAIIDTGIDSKHKFLKNKLWTTQNSPCKDIGYDFKLDKWPPSYDSAHGTHVAGIAASSAHSEIMDLKITHKGSADLFSALCAMKFAINNKAKVINCSWGYYADKPDPTFKEIVKLAKKENILIVASAGNHAVNTAECPHWPSGFAAFDETDNVIAVAALDENQFGLAKYSNYGQGVQLMAPGTNIMSTLPDNQCGSLSGTSMAAPFVTREVVDILYQNPRLNLDDTKNLLIKRLIKLNCKFQNGAVSWNKKLLSNQNPCR